MCPAASRSRSCSSLAVVVIAGLFWLVVPPLVSQLAQFAQDSPSYVTRFQHLRQEYISVKRHYPGAGNLDSEISSLAGQVTSGVGGQLVNLPTTVAKLLFDLAMIYVLSTLLVVRRERLLDSILLLVAPAPARPHARRDGEGLGAPGRLPAGQARSSWCWWGR